MIEDDDVTAEFRSRLRDAVERTAEGEADWVAFHARLGESVAARLGELRRRTSGGYRATAAAGAAWWDYTARFALAAVPIGLAAAVLLVAYLRSGDGSAGDARTAVGAFAPGSSDSARAAFESVLTGVAAPRAVIGALIPVPAAAFLAESAGGSAR